MKYKIKKEFFPFSHFTPPISEKFLAMAAPRAEAAKKETSEHCSDVSFLVSPSQAKSNLACPALIDF